MNFETEQKDGKLYVSIEVPHYNPNYGIDKKEIRTGHVEELLRERKIKHGKCIKKSHIKNWYEPIRRGQWIFELVVDKPAEPVIIEEEKSVKPKKTRRTRSSTTKVSTEE